MRCRTRFIEMLLLSSLLVAPAAPALAQRAYVTDSTGDTVTVIDTAASPPAVIGSPITVGTHPLLIAVTPDGSTLYVTNFGGNSVSVVDVRPATPKIVTTIPVDHTPAGIAVSPDGTRAYVTYGTTFAVIDATAKPPAIVTSATVGTGEIAISPDGTTAYVAQFGAGTVTSIDLTTTPPTVSTSPVSVGSEPIGIAISPDSSRLYVVNANGTASGTVSVLDATVTPPAVIRTITLGTIGPSEIAVARDGNTVYTGGNAFNVVDVAVNPPTVSAVTVGSGPEGIAVTPDGAAIYVANLVGKSVSVVDAATNAVTQTITVPGEPYGIAIGAIPPPPPPPPEDSAALATPTLGMPALALLALMLLAAAALARRERRSR